MIENRENQQIITLEELQPGNGSIFEQRYWSS